VPRRFENYTDVSEYEGLVFIKSNLELRLHCRRCIVILHGSSPLNFISSLQYFFGGVGKVIFRSEPRHSSVLACT